MYVLPYLYELRRVFFAKSVFVESAFAKPAKTFDFLNGYYWVPVAHRFFCELSVVSTLRIKYFVTVLNWATYVYSSKAVPRNWRTVFAHCEGLIRLRGWGHGCHLGAIFEIFFLSLSPVHRYSPAFIHRIKVFKWKHRGGLSVISDRKLCVAVTSEVLKRVCWRLIVIQDSEKSWMIEARMMSASARPPGTLVHTPWYREATVLGHIACGVNPSST